MNKDTDGEGKDANGWNARKNGKKIFRRNESAPVAYLSGGGEGVLPGAASVPSPNAANYKRNETEKRMAKPPPVQMGSRVFDPTMTPPREVGANGYVCTICTKSRTTLRGVLFLLQLVRQLYTNIKTFLTMGASDRN